MKKQPKILVLNGPNLNMLGMREPAIYGNTPLKDIEALCRKTAALLGLQVDCRQSNAEGDLVTWIQESAATHRGIVINAGAYTHTSIAILDALRLADLPTVEVHLTNIFKREHFRQHSFVAQAAQGVISGFGASGYVYALQNLAETLGPQRRK